MCFRHRTTSKDKDFFSHNLLHCQLTSFCHCDPSLSSKFDDITKFFHDFRAHFLVANPHILLWPMAFTIQHPFLVLPPACVIFQWQHCHVSQGNTQGNMQQPYISPWCSASYSSIDARKCLSLSSQFFSSFTSWSHSTPCSAQPFDTAQPLSTSFNLIYRYLCLLSQSFNTAQPALGKHHQSWKWFWSSLKFFFSVFSIHFSFYSFLLLKFQDVVLKKVKSRGK